MRSMLFLCEDLKICNEDERTRLQSITKQINTGIVKMISHLKTTQPLNPITNQPSNSVTQ